MNITQKIDAWSNRNTIKWIFLLRVSFGILLVFKGYSFISHTQELEAIISTGSFKSGAKVLAQYVTFSHFFGGAMIILGLLTRLAAVIQIPVMLGAIFFANTANGFMNVDSQLGLCILILILLIFFVLEGGGAYSMDRYLKRKQL
jgi:uncharacterized membrane protein YphA (DoxX/SURF4 family)